MLNKMLATAFAILFLTSSSYSSSYYNVYPIPKRYDHQPTKKMTLYEMSPAEVILHCGLAHACTYSNTDGSCTFYMPTGKSAYYWRHESAHCNGWPWNHPAK